MLLHEVHSYLVERGLINSDSILQGRFALQSIASRNPVFIVRVDNTANYFIKSINKANRENISTFHKEADCLFLFKELPRFKTINSLTSSIVDFSSEDAVLILEYIENDGNLDSIYESISRASLQICMFKVSEILKSFHFQLSPKELSHHRLRKFSKYHPWVLNIPDWFEGKSPPPFSKERMNNQVIYAITNYPEHLDFIRRTKAKYKFESLIHGDVKFSNLLFKKSENRISLKLVDWEISDIGDSLWDVAGFIHNILLSKIFSLERNRVTVDIKTVESLNLFHNEWLMTSIFWKNYMDIEGSMSAQSQNDWVKTLEFSAARLVQSAFEHNVGLNHIRTTVKLMMQLSLIILRNGHKLAHLYLAQPK